MVNGCSSFFCLGVRWDGVHMQRRQPCWDARPDNRMWVHMAPQVNLDSSKLKTISAFTSWPEPWRLCDVFVQLENGQYTSFPFESSW